MEYDKANCAHCVCFCSKLREYFTASKYTDVNIVCQNRIFRCHRLVLAAASEYFDTMFNGNFKEGQLDDIVLNGFDADILEQTLQFMYRGDISVNDDNVYHMLRVADYLKFSTMEKLCIRYLVERNIPIDYALEIFLFACATKKYSLVPAVSEFLLENVDRFSKNSAFTKIPLDDLNTLLMYWHPSTIIEEKALLSALFQWGFQSSLTYEQKEATFAEVLRNLEFEHISAECIPECWSDNIVDSREPSCDVDMLDTDAVSYTHLTLPTIYSV